MSSDLSLYDLNVHSFGTPIPVEDTEQDEIRCPICGEEQTGWVFYDAGTEEHYCEECFEFWVESEFTDALQDAEEHCKITRELPEYDPALEERCTPEEYETGDRESYSPDAYRCFCRHNCTNYDELIAGLERDSAEDQASYYAIRHKINELLEAAGMEKILEAAETTDDEDT